MENVNLLFDQELHLDLPMSGYRLIPGYSGQFGLPVEIYLRLFAVKDEEKRLIASPEDLSHVVTHIDDADAAWRFLRIFTAPATHYLFQKEIYTIDLNVATSDSPAGDGIISPAVAQRVGYQPPELTLENEKYVVSRDLVRASARERSALAEVFRRREALSKNASYEFIEDHMKGSVTRQDVMIPSYE